MSVLRCPHCGTANRAGSNFCNGCGTDLRNPDARPEEQPGPDEASPPAGSRVDAPPPAKPPAPLPRRLLRPGARPPAEVQPASPAPGPAPEELPFANQPWLRLEFSAEDAEEDDSAEPVEEATEEGGRLVTGIQGLLSPIRIATNIGADDPVAPPPPPLPPTADLGAEHIRLIRTLMAEPPGAPSTQVAPRRVRSLRVPWVFLLLGLAVGLPALFFVDRPGGVPYRWPGVEEAYAAIEDLAPGSLVTVYWAYDPATSGEMDLVMRPVVRHLLEQRVRLAVVSTFPGGPATARRLIASVRAGDGQSDRLALAADAGSPTTFAFLPGGAAVLALLARAPAAALLEDPRLATGTARDTVEREPRLVVVAAAHAEEAQDWLEQVQPLTGTPVVAVTGAGADPILRPYLDSRQMWGLVSGFDGAYAYTQLLQPFAPASSPPYLLLQVVLQNWGHLAFVIVILLGNLAALLGRDGGG